MKINLAVMSTCFLISSIALADNCPNVSDIKQVNSQVQATTPGGISLTSHGSIVFDPSKSRFKGIMVLIEDRSSYGMQLNCTYCNQENTNCFDITSNSVVVQPDSGDWDWSGDRRTLTCFGTNPQTQCLFTARMIK